MSESNRLTVRINDRCKPVDRGDHYEDPLIDALNESQLGEVTGGATHFNEQRVIQFCDLDVLVSGDVEQAKLLIQRTLELNGVPLGSKIIHGETEILIGNYEVMEVRFDSELPDSIWEEHDINDVLAELEELIGDDGRRNSNAEIENEVVVFYGGADFSLMESKIRDYFSKHPLAENGRITQQIVTDLASDPNGYAVEWGGASSDGVSFKLVG